jgi:peptidoglycan/xylan/chitin deacetylase (PgdA/CDA1 family)
VIAATMTAGLAALDAALLTQTDEQFPTRALWVSLTMGVALTAASGSAIVSRRVVSMRVVRRMAVVPVAITVGFGFWIGANTTTATWFGGFVGHGSRSDPRVALTFDDGPNATATLAIRDILDAHGAKGTFFEVGKAVEARPDISVALLADGQLLGNHSYHHDSFRWLDPAYRELGRTEGVFARRTGVCPSFFRPPHGQHTPFMARTVRERGMTMVAWDVSVGDWLTTNARTVARKVLDRVRSGSIVDLHDGLDGDVTTDRTVVVRALPLILDGLAAKGLRPARLDELLHRPGYLTDCSVPVAGA